MIPLQLSVKNFMCYRDDAPPLRFEGIHVACLCGDNGHGKTARLDTAHKDNILTKFFPYVGQQVLVLSTDSEIGFTQYGQISPYIASAHHLVRDAETGQTSIKEGYLVQ